LKYFHRYCKILTSKRRRLWNTYTWQLWWWTWWWTCACVCVL